ncbi:SWIM zinc finger family protein [Paenibacillus filicis]|uniref:SWIM zinc finger family protein n=1 Tax=Paenibacillus filicis TaxID=669464 RepID=A0ABU9DQE9_9BACL
MHNRNIKEWTRRLYSYFTLPTLQQGWRLLQPDHVVEYGIDDTEIVEGAVRREGGSILGVVTLNLEQLPASHCTCSKGKACEHLAAVALAYLDMERGFDIRDILKPGGNAWGSSSGMSRLSEAETVVSNGKASKAGLAAAPKIQVPGSASSVEDWHRFFQHRFPLERITSSRSLETLYDTVYGGLSPTGAAWPPALKSLYEIHILLFLFKLLDDLSEAGYQYAYGYDYYGMQQVYAQIVGQGYDRLLYLLSGVHREEVRRNYSERLQATADYLAQHAFPSSSSFIPWLSVYMSLWKGLLLDELSADREKARLSRASRQEGLSQTLFDHLMAARILFDVEAGEDEAALHKAGQLKLRGHIRLAPFLHSFEHKKQWDRLQLWLERLAPLIQKKWGQPDPGYYELWEELLDHHPAEKSWESVMIQLLPPSFPYYLDRLMKQERFREWVDLHLTFGYTPLDVRVSDYKPIELKQKHLLLPWFHHSIERLIAEKNRDAYKRAVRLMKKLRTTYGKLKQQERWELYLKHTSSKYSRLRALQEEMGQLRKGEA